MKPTTVVTYKWHTPGFRTKFEPETVNVLAQMVRRHYPHPHRFVCVTNDAEGIDRGPVEIVPDLEDFSALKSPHGDKFPSCYRRLRSFRPDIADVFGPRFVQIDIDCVLTADVTPVWDREEDFVIWGDTNPSTLYNGSMLLMTAGARAHVWDNFDPKTSPKQAQRAGNHGSDQAWISHCLGRGEPRFTKANGVYSYRNEIVPRGGRLPEDARIVFFHGQDKPWMQTARQRAPWIASHWRADVAVAS